MHRRSFVLGGERPAASRNRGRPPTESADGDVAIAYPRAVRVVVPGLEHRAVGAVAAVLLHLLVLTALVRVTTREVEPPPSLPAQKTGADTLRDAGERIVVPVDIRPSLSLSRRALACPGSSYVGVGITADPRTQRIVMVGDDTPASRAGLRPDDIVLNPDVWSDAHEDGAVLRVRVLRDEGTTVVAVRVGWICIG